MTPGKILCILFLFLLVLAVESYQYTKEQQLSELVNVDPAEYAVTELREQPIYLYDEGVYPIKAPVDHRCSIGLLSPNEFVVYCLKVDLNTQ